MLDAADLAAVRQAKYDRRKRLNQVALTLSMAPCCLACSG
jgi:phosphate transport system permease protein